MRGLRRAWRWAAVRAAGLLEDARGPRDPARDPGPSPAKLHLIVREDLPAGLQAAQLVHAATEFMSEHPEEAMAWRRDSNCVALLAVPDEPSLRSVAARARRRSAKTSEFREPDLGGSLTSLAVAPSRDGRRVCGSLPLAFREKP